MVDGQRGENGNGVATKTAVALAELSGTIREFVRQQEKHCSMQAATCVQKFQTIDERLHVVERRSKENERKIEMKLSSRGLMLAMLPVLAAVAVLLLRYGPAVKELMKMLEATP